MALGDFLTEAERERARAAMGTRDLPAAGRVPGVIGTLRSALAADLDREQRLYSWRTYGGGVVAMAGNDTEDIPIRVDPAAWFVATELQVRSSGPAINLLVQVIQDGDKQLFRNAMPLALLRAIGCSEHGAVFPLPKDWIFRPGGTVTIRLSTRTADVVDFADAALGGYGVTV